MDRKRLLPVWRSMKARCTNPLHNRWSSYGGRGITVCDEWLDQEVFLEWAEESYEPGLTLERFDNDLGYSPSNCTWATKKQQQQHRRNNRLETYKGETKSLAAWADDNRSSVPYKVLWERLQDGWTFEAALTTKPRRKNGYRLLTALGETKSMSEWADDPRCNISVPTLWKRIKDGWPAEKAVVSPLGTKR